MTFGYEPYRLDAHVRWGYPFRASIPTQDGSDYPPVTVEMRFDSGVVWPAIVSGAVASWDVPASVVSERAHRERFGLVWDGDVVWAEGALVPDSYAGLGGRSSVMAMPGDTGAQVIATPTPPGPRGYPGEQGAPGPVDLAYSNGILPVGNGGTGQTTLPGLMTEMGLNTRSTRAFGPLTECVVIGASNAVPSTLWPDDLAADWGLTARYATVSGSGFGNGPGTFGAQIAAQANNPEFDNDNVGLVLIVSAGNNVRQQASIEQYVVPTLSAARAAWPNARIVLIPVIWPSTPSVQALGTGGFQPSWHTWLHRLVDEMRRGARECDVEIVDQSWTWLTGRDDLMESSGGVHPNLDGYQVIRGWVNAHLRGESTRADAPWTPCATENGSSTPVATDIRTLSVRREGWLINLEGALISSSTVPTAGHTDLGRVPLGFRPTTRVEAACRRAATPRAATIYPSGLIRVWENVPASSEVALTCTYVFG